MSPVGFLQLSGPYRQPGSQFGEVRNENVIEKPLFPEFVDEDRAIVEVFPVGLGGKFAIILQLLIHGQELIHQIENGRSAVPRFNLGSGDSTRLKFVLLVEILTPRRHWIRQDAEVSEACHEPFSPIDRLPSQRGEKPLGSFVSSVVIFACPVIATVVAKVLE